MTISSRDGTGSPVGQTHRYSQHQGSLDLFGESPLEKGVDGDSRGPVAPISEDWPAPELIGADIEAPEPYPIQALGELQDVVIAVQDMTGTSTATAAAMSLSAISFLAQMDYMTRTLGNDAPPSLFILVLVGSGGRKSSTFDLSHGAHVRSDDDLAVRYDAALEAWDNYKEGRDSGETVPPAPRTEPPHALQTNVSLAAALQSLRFGRPSLCLANPDAGSSMTNWSSRGTQASEMYQTLALLWDGTPYTHGRAGRPGSTYRLRDRRLSIAWMAQPDFAEWLFGEKGMRGLSARFLTSKDDKWRAPILSDDQIGALVAAEADNYGTPPVPPALQHYWDVITAVRQRQDAGMEYKPGARDGDTHPFQLITRSPEAHRLLLQYARDCALKAEGQENQHVVGFLRRAAEHVCRIAAVMVAWRCYQAEVRPRTPEGPGIPPLQMDEADFHRAAEVVDWYIEEGTRITDTAGYAEVATQAHRLSRFLARAAAGEIVQSATSGRSYLSKGGRVQVRSLIAQRMKSLAKDPGLQEKVLRVLGQHEHIRMYGGTQCAVNPGLRELYSDKSRGQSHPDVGKRRAGQT